MAKKRKASAQSRDQQTSFDVDPAKSKLRVDTYEDVADSEDEFHINRDKILLDEEPQAKRMRKWKEQGMLVRQVIWSAFADQTRQTNSCSPPTKKS